MVFFLILGVLLGAASVMFILQNITPITVAFFSWQIEGSLAVILLLAMLAGMLITALLLLPGFVRGEFHISRLRKQNKKLEDEVASKRTPAFTDGTEEGTIYDEAAPAENRENL